MQTRQNIFLTSLALLLTIGNCQASDPYSTAENSPNTRTHSSARTPFVKQEILPPLQNVRQQNGNLRRHLGKLIRKQENNSTKQRVLIKERINKSAWRLIKKQEVRDAHLDWITEQQSNPDSNRSVILFKKYIRLKKASDRACKRAQPRAIKCVVLINKYENKLQDIYGNIDHTVRRIVKNEDIKVTLLMDAGAVSHQHTRGSIPVHYIKRQDRRRTTFGSRKIKNETLRQYININPRRKTRVRIGFN